MFFLEAKPVTYTFLIKRAKRLHAGWSQTGGRNSSGHITSYKKGSFRYKRVYRFIDFWRRLTADAFVIAFDKDNFRTTKLALVFYQTGYLSYIVLPEGFAIGDKIKFSNYSSEIGWTGEGSFLGHAFPLKHISDGLLVFNIELWPLKGAQLCRAAGTYGIIVARRNGFVTVKLRSGWKLVLSESCYATVGVAPDYKNIYKVLRKAGLRVNLGRRPTTRGVAMNAIDHPHGGGRGKTSGGPRPRTPWGFITKQRKTVLKKLRVAKLSVRFR